MPAEVIIRNLCKSYGPVAALRGLNLEIGAGEIFGLLGTNGAGKTTAVECLVGLRAADVGEILIDGIDLKRQSAEAKQRIGVVLQSTALPDQITPTEALDLFGSLYRQRLAPAVLLDRFGLTREANKRFASLSGGQRQRLALALAFVNKPDLVVLDEPTAGLDAHARRDLHEAILRLKHEGHTVLLTTHHLDEAEQLCDRVAILNRGQILVTGTPSELIDRVGGHHTMTLLTHRPVNLARLTELPGVLGVSAEGLSVKLSTSDGSLTIQALMPLLAADHLELVDLHLRRATLEEAFVGLTRSGQQKSAGDST